MSHSIKNLKDCEELGLRSHFSWISSMGREVTREEMLNFEDSVQQQKTLVCTCSTSSLNHISRV